MEFTYATECGPSPFPLWPLYIGLPITICLFFSLISSRPPSAFRATLLPLHFFSVSGVAGFHTMFRALATFPAPASTIVSPWREALWSPYVWGLASTITLLGVHLCTRSRRTEAIRLLSSDRLLWVAWATAIVSWSAYTILLTIPGHVLAHSEFGEPDHWVRRSLLVALLLQLLLVLAHIVITLIPTRLARAGHSSASPSSA